MQINVHLLGILRDHLPREAKGRATVALDDGATVSHLLAQLGVKRRVIVVLTYPAGGTGNDDHEPDETHVLQDGDKVSIYTIIGGGQ